MTMATERRVIDDRIVQDPEIMVGRPVIRGTRIPVERVIAQLAHEPHLDDLFAAYPELTVDDVKAALAYAHEAVSKQRGRTPPKDELSPRVHA